MSHVVGISHEGGDPDVPGLEDIEFAISLNYDNNVYVLEDAAAVINGPFAPQYTPGERFRLRIRDKNNGSAEISYFRIVGPCNPGTQCSETPLGGVSPTTVSYPIRIHATFREPAATISTVTMVRIKDVP